MEPLIVIVGFLGSGKTTLLKSLVKNYLERDWNPFIILNDYQNANLDIQHFTQLIDKKNLSPLSGSCICCSGVQQLRETVNDIPHREKGITFIEANGTTDACTLLGFLSVGIKENFLPPVQVSIVDTRHWQKRGIHNELEANQIQASSLILLNYTDHVSKERLEEVKTEIRFKNPAAKITVWNKDEVLPELRTQSYNPQNMDHLKTHWSSVSKNLPDPMKSHSLQLMLQSIPSSVLRVKGCTRIDGDKDYTFFERLPGGEIIKRPYYGELVSGAQVILIGPGCSDRNLRIE